MGLTSVRVHVLGELSAASEFLRAEMTLVGPLARMHPQMQPEPLLQRERLATMVADEQLGIALGQQLLIVPGDQVTSQPAQLGEAGVAVRAFVLFGPVDARVATQLRRLLEPLRTFLALVLLLSGRTLIRHRDSTTLVSYIDIDNATFFF